MKLSFKNNQIRQIALFIVAGHTALFIIQIPQVYLYGPPSAQNGLDWIPIARLAWGSLTGAFLTPFILWVGYLVPVNRRDLLRNLSLHTLLGIAAAVIQHFGYNVGLMALNLMTPEIFRSNVLDLKNIFSFIPSTLVRYAVIVAIQQAYLYFRESQERAALLREAELEILKIQLHPHFFFNTLNAISALIDQSPKEAKRLVAQLGDLFRITLRKDKAQEIPLRNELKFLETYFRIHQTLMGKRLQVEWRIGPETLDAPVPNLILQPLAENAIQHGIAPLEAGGTITICAARNNENLLLQVSDNGEGFAFGNNGDGIGLSNTRARLENLYGDAHDFSIAERADGVTVKIEIPFQENTPD